MSATVHAYTYLFRRCMRGRLGISSLFLFSLSLSLSLPLLPIKCVCMAVYWHGAYIGRSRCIDQQMKDTCICTYVLCIEHICRYSFAHCSAIVCWAICAPRQGSGPQPWDGSPRAGRSALARFRPCSHSVGFSW